ncbi:phage tail protein [Streptomyces malaysiensis]|uniref:phage tail protein n=1 Tax=Streptomyces malaysiensis TaxID=92644 RepID=UPI00369A3F47
MKSASERSGKPAAAARAGPKEHPAPHPAAAPVADPASASSSTLASASASASASALSLEQTAAPAPTPAPVSPSTAPGLAPRHLQRLQAAAGNSAVSRLVAQRYAAPVKPPPSQAPGFRKVQSDVAAKKRKLAQHNPAAAESRSAQDAAVAPPDDKEAQGKAANAEKMNAAKPGEFDKAGFIAAVNEAIAAQAPKNLDEADKFADSGKADKIKGEVDGKVTDGKNASSKDIETTTKAAPDTSQAKEKEVTPMKPDQPPANPGAPNAADATPQQQPPEVTDFSEGPKKTDQQMADADVTEEQLAKSNEPEFTAALGEKKKAEQHSETAPGQARAAEKQQLATAKSHASGAGTQAMSALTAARAGAGKQVDGGKGETKSKDEQKREEVTAKLQKVFDAAKKDVEGILEGLDGKVDKQFEEGEKKARDAFNKDQKRRMKEYKDKRYGGFWGPAKWAKDKIAGMPAEANELFQESRKLYVNQMQGVISSIADTIGTELGKAKTRIAKGRAELKAEVDKLPADLKKYGQDAAKDFAGKFDDLESEVNDKSKELVQTLAQKYTQALNAVDEEIKKLQEANKGLVQKAVDAVVGVIKTINDLKNLLMGILAKAASAIMKIIKDPIGFLGNLVRSVGAGLQQFMSNIGTHLQTGLVSWLLGTSVKAGIEIPAKFDLKGIIQLIASLLGLTWANIRSRITRKGVPDQAMSKAEQSVPVAKALATEGPAGAAKEITAETGDLKSTILEELKSYLIPTVIIAGITWILSLLNPASAFVRAAKAIIDIVSFVVNQGAQIVDFVNAVLDAVIAIANGGAAGVPKTIETALAASIPLLIGLLASLLGIGGLANKIKQVFQKVSRPVNRAIDKIVTKIAQAAKRLWKKGKPKNAMNRTGQGRGGVKRAEGYGQKNKRDPGLGKKINDDLQKTLGSSVDGASIKPAVRAVYGRWRRKGLRNLEIEPTKGSPGHFSIFSTYNPVHHYEITAKAPEPVFTIPENVLTSAAMEFKGEIVRFTHETYAVATVKSAKHWGFPETSSENGKHAEQRIIEHIVSNGDKFFPRQKWGLKNPTVVPDREAKFVLKVTRSPCPEICAPKIGGLRDQVRERGWNLHTTVLALGLYKPFGSGDEEAPRYPKLGSGESSTGEPVGRAGLQILKDWEVDMVGVLSIDDPAIKSGFSSLSQQEQQELAKLIARWNRRLLRNINRIWPQIPGKIGGL